MPVSIGNFTTEQVFVVVNALTVDCLLGADYLVSHGAIIDHKCGYVVIKDNKIPFTRVVLLPFLTLPCVIE